ncbi:MAG: hypothetical protein ABSB59_34685 [Streptosporangiaceae bacterium]
MPDPSITEQHNSYRVPPDNAGHQQDRAELAHRVVDQVHPSQTLTAAGAVCLAAFSSAGRLWS